MIDLPEKLSAETLDRFERAIVRAQGPMLVVHGACRGMDLEAYVDGDPTPELARYAGLLRTIRECPMPSIAAIDGEMIGGGVGIAASCDIVIATPRTTFALPEALFGLFPGVVVPSLLHRMTPHAVHLLAMLGTARGVDWAQANGLLDEVSDDLERSIARWSRSLGRVDTRRVVELREWTCSAGGDFEQGADRSARAFAEPRVREITRAFLRDGEAPWLR